MAEKIKIEETTKTETKAEDFDFKSFLAQIGKENPDMSVIKAGIEKYGTGHLSDSQKSQFLQVLFPEENQFLSLGFENMQGIANTMAALEDLYRNGKLQPEQVKNVLQSENPRNKRNMVTTLALNIRAGEFKSPHLKGEKDRKIIGKNIETAEIALDFLGELDKDIIKEVIDTPDNSDRKLSLVKLAASGKSKILSKFVNRDAFQSGEIKDAITVDDNTTVIGGDDKGITIDGKDNSPKKGLNVNTPQEEQKDLENTANMNPNAGDDHRKRRPIEFEKIKEQDIIQYMFENWFLELATAALKAPFWVLNKCLDALDSKFDTSIPKTSLKAGEKEKNAKAVKFLNERGKQVASACMSGIETQQDYYDSLHDTVKNNIGKKAGDWKIGQYKGRPVVNAAVIKNLNDMYTSSPNDFKNKLEALKTISDKGIETIDLYMQIAARMAVAQYMANNPEGPFDNEAETRLKQMAMDNTGNIIKTIKLINDRMEFNYRLEQKIAPDTPLTDAQKDIVAKNAEPIVEKFMEDLTSRGADLRSSVNNYHQRGTDADKKNREKAMATNAAALQSIWSDEYLSAICPSELKHSQDGSISLYDLAQQEVKSELMEKMFTEAMNLETAQLEAAKQAIEQRKQAYNNNPKFRRMQYATSRISGKAQRTGAKIKDTGKAIGMVLSIEAKENLKKGGETFTKMKNKLLGRKI